jgi:hypothetical protein
MFGVSQATTGWVNTSSTASQGYGSPAATGIYLGMLKQPANELTCNLGRWKFENNQLTDFKEISFGDGKKQLITSVVVALANKFFLIWAGWMDRAAKIYEYDAETLALTNSSPDNINAAGCQLSGAGNLLFLTPGGLPNVKVLTLDFVEMFTLNLDLQLFQIPFFSVTSDSIVCVSCNGAAQTFDFNGTPTSSVVRFNDLGSNPFITKIDDSHMYMGFYDGFTKNTCMSVLNLNPLRFLGPQFVLDAYVSSAFNTASGIVLSGPEVTSLGAYPHFSPNYSFYTYPEGVENAAAIAINPNTLVTCDDQLRVWQLQEGVTAPVKEVTLRVNRPTDKVTPTMPWNEITSLDLKPLIPGLNGIQYFVTDNMNRIFFFANNSMLMQFSYDSTTQTLTDGSTLSMAEGVILQAFFFCGGHLFATTNTMNNIENYQVDPETLAFTKLDIHGRIYPIDSQSFAALNGSSRLTIYDAASLKPDVNFPISENAANVAKVGNYLIGVETDSIKKYNLDGIKLQSVETGFYNAIYHSKPVLTAPNRFIVGIDDLTLQTSTIQEWQLNPLKIVESNEIPQLNIGQILLTPQGTLFTGAPFLQSVTPTIHVAGPSPESDQFSYIATNSQGVPLNGSNVCLLPNGLVAVATDKLQLFEPPSAQFAAAQMSKERCTAL